MSSTNPVFQWTDAWLLAAIAVGGGLEGAVLKEIFAAGDLINRTAFTPQELRSGLAKLFHRGYAVRMGERFVIAGDARVALVKAVQEPFSSFSVMQFFEEFLHSRAYGTGDRGEADPAWRYDALTDEVVAGACAEYKAEVEHLNGEVRKDVARG